VPILHLQPDDKAGFLSWMVRHRPGMVMGSDNAFYWWLREAGYRVPKDVGFVSLAASPEAGSGSSISGVDCNIDRIGQAAVEQLDILIRTNQAGIPDRPFALMIVSNWVAGDTLGKAARRMRGRPALSMLHA
jgi:LacI family transcriptional regulator